MIAGAFALLVILAVAFVLLNASTIATKVKDRVLPEVSSRLGREVRVGDVHIDIWPPISVAFENVAVEGAANEPPIVQATRASTQLKLWPLITSRGNDIQIESVQLQSPQFNLVRRADGHWNYEDLTKGGAKEAQKPPQPSHEREIAVSSLNVTDGRVRVIDEAGQKSGARNAATVGVTQIFISTKNLSPGRPATIELDAAVASKSKNLKATITIDALPASAADLEKALPKVTGNLSLDSLALAKLEGFLPAQFSQMTSGGVLSTKASLATSADGRYTATGQASLRDLDVRGSPSSGSFKFVASMNPKASDSLSAEVTDLTLQGPGIDLSGKASYVASAHRIRYDLRGQRLDLDTLIGVLPPSKNQEKESGEPLVPPTMRSTVRELDVAGTLALREIRSGKLTAQNLAADTKLSKGVLTVSKGSIELYNGKATLDGTTVNLAAEKPEWALKAKVDALDLNHAMMALTGSSPMSGLISGSMNLTGAGNDWNQLRTNVTGDGLVTLAQGALTSTDLTAKIAQPLTTALQQLGQAGPKTALPLTGTTQLKDLSANFSVQDGWIRFKAPLTVNTPFGALALNGRVGLDQRLDVEGKAILSKDFLTSIAGGRFQPRGPVDLPLNFGGSLKDPSLQGVNWNQFAQDLIVKQGIQPELQKQQKQLENQAQERMRGFLRGL
jgi:AsmA protein